MASEVELIQKLFFELLQYGRAAPSETVAFEAMTHNADLCPVLTDRCNQILETVARRFSMAHDVQGPGDAGIDVLITLTAEGDDVSFIGFQVKADNEARKGLSSILKTQYFDARAKYGDRLVAYYIVLAWNSSTRTEYVRLVSQTFSTIPRAHVIVPAYALTFLQRLRTSQIEAMAGTYLESGDPLLAQLRRAVADLTARQVALLVELTASFVEGDSRASILQLETSRHVEAIYQTTEGLLASKGVHLPPGIAPVGPTAEPTVWEWESLPADLECLEEFLDEADTEGYRLDREEAFILIAVATDARARYGHRGKELRDYLVDLIGVTVARTGRQRASLIGEMFVGSDLGKRAATTLAVKLLKANCPELAAEGLDGEPFGEDDDEGWRKVAWALIRDLYRY